MKIVWKPLPGETGSALVLGDDALGQRGSGTKVVRSAHPVGIAFAVQLAEYPGSDEAEAFGRGNKRIEYAAIVDYEFRTLGEASTFLHQLATDLDNSGTLEITHDGGQIAMICALAGIQVLTYLGLFCAVQYTFIGGAMNKGPASNLVPANL